MIENIFPELLMPVQFNFNKKENVFDEMGRPATIQESITFNAIVENGLTLKEERVLGYTVDKLIYTSNNNVRQYVKTLNRDDMSFTVSNAEFIIKKVEDYYDHMEIMLVNKNV